MTTPVEFKERMKNMLDDYDEFIEAMEKSPESGVRINERKKGAERAVLGLCGELERVEWCDVGYYADKSVINGKSPYHHAGLFYFQEPSAMAVGEAVRINPDDRILDLCAAPGGKSAHIGAKLGKGGLLVANEVIPKRARILAENMERLGIGAVVLSEFPERLEERFFGFFDKIFVDAPCSGEGMFRKEPSAIEEWSEAHSLSCAARQAAIMESAAKTLVGGGYIIYSTCTFAPCENEGVIEGFLKRHPDFELCDMPRLAALSEGTGKYINSQTDFSAARRIFPHRHRGEGHFIALLRHKGERKNRACPRIRTDANTAEAVRVYREFEKEFLNCRLEGFFELFGSKLYLRSAGVGSLDKLKTLRAGLYLGDCAASERGKIRFEPSYALAHFLDAEDIKFTASYPCGAGEIEAYLSGAQITGYDICGYAAVCVDGFNLGWGKASGGVIKNKYPKKLRNPPI